jgi:DNA-directed RNA polymerase specialized sigma24 family protein
MNEKLRTDVKLLKALQGVSYKEIAEYLEIKQDSLYSWLRGYYNLSEEKIERLQDVIACIKE